MTATRTAFVFSPAEAAGGVRDVVIVLRTGRKPTKRIFETIQFHLLGWVSDEEFDAHLAALSAAKKSK